LSTEKICPSAQTVVKARIKATNSKPESGPKIEIAIEEVFYIESPERRTNIIVPEHGIEPERGIEPDTRAR